MPVLVRGNGSPTAGASDMYLGLRWVGGSLVVNVSPAPALPALPPLARLIPPLPASVACPDAPLPALACVAPAVPAARAPAAAAEVPAWVDPFDVVEVAEVAEVVALADVPAPLTAAGAAPPPVPDGGFDPAELHATPWMTVNNARERIDNERWFDIKHSRTHP